MHIPPGASVQTFRCTIKNLFRNCPKPDGWFGCFASVRGHDDIKLTGVSNIPVAKGMVLDVEAYESPTEINSYTASKVTIVTKTMTGLVSYLSSIAMISRSKAQELVDAFGQDILSVIGEGKDTLKEKTDGVVDLSDKQLTALVESVNNLDIENRVAKLLPEISSDKKVIKRIIENIKDPINSIKKNPYVLQEIRGITFPVIDTIAVRLGIDPASDIRIKKGIIYYIKNMGGGNLYLNLSSERELKAMQYKLEELLRVNFANLNVFSRKILAACNCEDKTCDEDNDLVIDQYGIEYHLYLRSVYEAQQYTVSSIHNMIIYSQTNDDCVRSGLASNSIDVKACIRRYENNKNFTLNAEQKTAVEKAITHRLSVITGGPGRGKTTIIDCIADIWSKISSGEVILLAPTGKAVNKLDSATDATSKGYIIKTIDRIVCEVKYGKLNNKKSYNNPYDSSKNLVIIDESSMIDMKKMYALLSTIPTANICFVGDADQLPPIEPGTVFKDIIDSGINIPITYLKKPMRNKGNILENSEKVNNNDTSLKYNFTDMPFFAKEKDDDNTLNFILDQYADEKSENPDITQLAIICPIKKGTIGTDCINIKMQDIACPVNHTANITTDKRRAVKHYIAKGYPIKETIFDNATNYTHFRIGDIIMITKNNDGVETFDYSNNDYWNGEPTGRHQGIFNGDCGRIISYIPAVNQSSKNTEESHSFLVIKFFNNRFAKLDITAGETEDMSLGYALTVHKAQGCEYDTVIYVSPNKLVNFTRNGFACKNLVYTAFTRAKKRLVIIGSKDSINACIQTNIPERNSNFKERLQ